MLHKLDRIDLNILQELQKNGKLTNLELSKRVGISPPPCLRRIKNLEDAGFIVGYQANLNAFTLGFNISLFCEIGLKNQNEQEIKDFEDKIKTFPLIRECYMITGGYDFLLKIVARDFDEYQNFLATKLACLENIIHVKTHMIVRASKKEIGLPLEILEN